MNKICVYAIAKNEEANVESWYNSMKFADHIIVLDTGSIDNTVEKLKELGVEVHQKEYEHFRFDDARNDSLDLVPDEYNIRVCTDLDERFAKDDWADILREKWDDDKPRAVYSYVWAHTDDGQPALKFIINKIHGIDPNLRWWGAVHEHLTFMDTLTREFDACIDLTNEIELHHFADLSRDRKFYIQLMEERLKDNPDDSQTYILLGNEYRVKDDSHKAIKIYTKALEKFKDTYPLHELAGLYYVLGLSYYNVGEAISAMKAFTEGIATCMIYRDNYYGLALIYVDNQMYHAAIGIIQEALARTQRAYSWLEDNFTWTFAMYDLLRVAYFNLGDYENAFIAAQAALNFDSENPILLEHYQECYDKIYKK